MQKTVTGTAITMTRASGSTTPRWTLTMVVVVVKASMNPLNSTVSLRVDDSAAEDEPRGNYCDFFSGWAINVSRREDARDRQVLGAQVL